MKQGWICLIFAVFYLCCLFLAEERQSNYQEKQEEQEYVQYALSQAMRAALQVVVEEEGEEKRTAYLLAKEEFESVLRLALGRNAQGEENARLLAERYAPELSELVFTRADRYLVELPENSWEGKPVYHKPACTEIGKNEVRLEPGVTISEAIRHYGAFACPYCFSEHEAVTGR